MPPNKHIFESLSVVEEITDAIDWKGVEFEANKSYFRA